MSNSTEERKKEEVVEGLSLLSNGQKTALEFEKILDLLTRATVDNRIVWESKKVEESTIIEPCVNDKPDILHSTAIIGKFRITLDIYWESWDKRRNGSYNPQMSGICGTLKVTKVSDSGVEPLSYDFLLREVSMYSISKDRRDEFREHCRMFWDAISEQAKQQKTAHEIFRKTVAVREEMENLLSTEGGGV